MNIIHKFYNEHRIGYAAILDIEKSKESPQVRIGMILQLFEKELLPHFKQEESELFTNDFGSKILLKEHAIAYDMIDKMKVDKSEKNIQPFLTLMKDHIHKEEEYFRSIKHKEINFLPYIIIAIIAFIAGFLVAKFL